MNQKNKHDKDKNRLELIPNEWINGLGKVLTMGAEKYDDNTWQNVKMERYRGAMLRHVFAEEEIDKESGLTHLLHIAVNALFIYSLKRKDKTDAESL